MPIPLYVIETKTVAGELIKYKKVISGGFLNPEVGIPSIFFNEALVTILPDTSKVVLENIGVLHVPYLSGNTFPLIDETGTVVGSMTTDQVYQALACLYYAKALERDAML
jgi:hypothetical protein